jgi:hypothetical protein
LLLNLVQPVFVRFVDTKFVADSMI